MSKRQSFIVGEHFATKKDLETRIRGIVDSYRDGETLGMFDFQFMLDLFSNHPHAAVKFGTGIDFICVQRNPVYPSTRGFYLVRTDGTGTDISWRECLTPTPKIKKVKAALRVLIEPHTMEFKQRFFDERGGAAACEITGQAITFIGSHVDHRPPKTFDVIFDQFFSECGVDPEGVDLKDELADNKYQDELADTGLAEKWIAYHNQHAQLRVISALANLSHVKRA